MTAQTRSGIEGAVSNLFLNLDGQDMSAELFKALDTITVDSSLHLPDVATVTLRDPLATLVDDERFKLGTRVKVVAQVKQNKETVFDGEIVEIEPRFTGHTQELRLRAFDRLHRLARGTHTRSFQNVSDMDLVEKLAKEANLRPQLKKTGVVHPYVLQHNQTNLAFLRERMSRLGHVLYADGENLRCEPLGGEGTVELRWGDNLLEFLPRLTSFGQTAKTTVRSWDPAEKRVVVGQAASGRGKAQVAESTRSESVAQGSFNMEAADTTSTLIVRDQAYASAIAQAQRNTRAEGLLEATGTCGGYPRLTAGTTLNIQNVGQRFSGQYVASSVRHLYRTGQGYHTEFVVSGSRAQSLASMIQRAGGGAGGAHGQAGVTPAPGLMIGIVTNNDDPENLGRVKLKLPALTEDDETDWARVVSVGGGKQRGLDVTPEVNDEVLVGFEHGDVHHPYVLGGLWNGRDGPPRETARAVKGGKVIQRVLRTRAGHELIFDDSDDKMMVQVLTASGHRLTLADKRNPYVELRDKNGNELYIDTQSGALRLQTKGRMEIKAGQGIKIDGGGGNVDVRGVMINLN